MKEVTVRVKVPDGVSSELVEKIARRPSREKGLRIF